MSAQDYTTVIHTSTSAKEAVARIEQVGAWWTTSFQGTADRVGDTFDVRFGDTFVTFEVVEHAENRIVWHVKDSVLPWLRDKSEWTGTNASSPSARRPSAERPATSKRQITVRE